MDLHYFGYATSLEMPKEVHQSHAGTYHLAPKTEVRPGTIQVVEGPMGSGKSTSLIRYVETYGRLSTVLFINHSIDNRDGDDAPVSSRSVLVNSTTIRKLNATYVKISKLKDLDPLVLEKHSVVIIDEAQFFDDLIEEVTRYCDVLGKTVIAAGLLSDYKREPFGHLLKLMMLADSHIQLEGLCEDCLDVGLKAKSLFTRSLVKMDGQVKIGKDTFKGCCRECYLKFGGEPK